MRNPFRRQTETAAPTLRDRAADLRASLRPLPAAPASLPAPGSAEARDAWEAVCREHSKRTQALTRHPELAQPQGGAWTTDTLNEALDFGVIKPADFARLYPIASEFELGLEQIGHDLNIHALFALAHATEFLKEGGATPAAPTEDTFPPAPADLADACRWAIQHRAWADRVSSVQDWSDERGDAELDRTSAVFTRAINEPSTNLREITAKAALALEDFERFTLRPGHKPDDGARIVHTVLREVVGVGRETSAFQAPGPVDLLAAARMDIRSASLRELVALQDAVDLLSGVAAAITCQPKCKKGEEYNCAGRVVEELLYALDRLFDALAKEIRSRTPSKLVDARERLAALAVSTINNGDPTQTAALARELLAMVKQ